MSDTLLRTHVSPRGSRNQIVGWKSEVLHVKLTAAPVDGAANTQLIEFIASILDIPKRDIKIANGIKSRSKTLRIQGVTIEKLTDKLGSP